MAITEKILVLGAGKMTEGILRGLASKMDLSNVFIFSPSGKSAQRLADKVGGNWIQDLNSIRPDLMLIGCKPQQIRELKKIIGEKFNHVPTLSILAALSEKTQMDILGVTELVRIMPNLAVAFNQGVSLVSSVSSNKGLDKTCEIFKMLGHVEVVSEAELEDLTLLTGSSPAFFYEFASTLAASFGSLDEKKRELLIRKSLLGAAETIRHSHESLGELISNVTSKGGVTIAVLEELRRKNLNDMVSGAVSKGHQRARDLSASILQS